MTLTSIIFGLALMAICAGFVFLFLFAFHRAKFVKALVFKGLASICFIALGAILCFDGGKSSAAILVFVGLCFGILGDEVIALCQIFPKQDDLAFVGGGSCFIVGHILYIFALLSYGRPSLVAIAISCIVAAVLSALYAGIRRFLSGKMRVPLALYLGLVVFVFALSVGVFVNRLTVGSGLFVLGGALFALSDNVLFAYKKGEKPKFRQNIILHIAYYLAQFAIAWSIALM
jgi:uncharacterized membrane protein YhhN